MAKKGSTTSPLRILVLDILKPHKPDLVDFSKLICKNPTVEIVNMSVDEIDEKTESVKMVLEGKDINFGAIKGLIEEHGGVIHSIDKVVTGKKEIVPVPKLADDKY
ncbi:MAG: DUF211 domain-containing protein [archaeon]